jgi:UMF1 family MFS transporter
VGLTRPELRAWALYDCADSAFWTTVIAAVFPRFFSDYAAAGLTPTEATARFAWTTTIAITIAAVLCPILGAIADYRSARKRMLAVGVIVGAVATVLMVTIVRSSWIYAAVLFAIANIAVAAGRVFYDSLLPHIATSEELDRVSTAGYAVGYLGGGLLLLVNLGWIFIPATFGLPSTAAAMKLSFACVGVWWILFTIPLLWRVPEPPAVLKRGETGAEAPVRVALVRIWKSFRELRGYRHAFLMLLAFLLYSDGIETIIRMATIYGAEVGINQNAQIAAFVIVQFIGVPCSFLFGAAAASIGPKPALYVAIAIYMTITMFGYFMTTEWHFFALAFLVAIVQGGSQALSRSLFARMIPKHKSAEFFGFFSVFEKFAGIAGPALFAASVSLFGSSRAAVLSVLLFFIFGALVLTRVNVAEGEARAIGEIA